MDDVRCVEDLIRLSSREPVKYLFFWGHRPNQDGSLGAGCLSQWWPAVFTVDGRRFATAEHYMMWRKALLFEDLQACEQILSCPTPAQAKKAGRLVRGFDEDLWSAERFQIVVDASVAKFGSDPRLRDFLLGTRRRVLVEASPRDRVWGIGMGASNPSVQDPAAWKGLNLLGFALMAARAQLAED